MFPQFIVRFAKKPSTPVPCKSTSVTSWSVDDVVQWMKSLGSGKDYSSVIQANLIDGDALSNMTPDDFKDAGITAVGDLSKIRRGLGALK